MANICGIWKGLSGLEGVRGSSVLEFFGDVRCTSGIDLAPAEGADLPEELRVCGHFQLKDGDYNWMAGGSVNRTFATFLLD